MPYPGYTPGKLQTKQYARRYDPDIDGIMGAVSIEEAVLVTDLDANLKKILNLGNIVFGEGQGVELPYQGDLFRISSGLSPDTGDRALLLDLATRNLETINSDGKLRVGATSSITSSAKIQFTTSEIDAEATTKTEWKTPMFSMTGSELRVKMLHPNLVNYNLFRISVSQPSSPFDITNLFSMEANGRLHIELGAGLLVSGAGKDAIEIPPAVNEVVLYQPLRGSPQLRITSYTTTTGNLSVGGSLEVIGEMKVMEGIHNFSDTYRIVKENPTIILLHTNPATYGGQIIFQDTLYERFFIKSEQQQLKVGSTEGGIECGATTRVFADDELVLQAEEIYAIGNVSPNSNNAFDLGSSDLRWKNGYFAGTVSMGSFNSGAGTMAGDLTIGKVNPTIILQHIGPGHYGGKISFWDINEEIFYIKSEEGKLKIGSVDGGIECAASTVVRGVDEVWLHAPCIIIYGNLLPERNGVYDFGTPDTKFNDAYFAGTVNMGSFVAGSGTMNGTLNTQALVPTTDATYDLATPSLRYKNLYLSGGVIV